VQFVGYLYIMGLINAGKMEHIKAEKYNCPCERKWRIDDCDNQELMDRL
jgi:hypothetical protein